MSLSGKKILYIDDNPANLKLVNKLLSAEGCIMLEASDGVTGIDLARSARPDLILMDMHMPGLQGSEVTTFLKSHEEMKDVPIIALTADDSNAARDRCLAAGCVGYITKPIDVVRFGGQITSYLSGMHEGLSEAEKSRQLSAYTQDLVIHLELKVRALNAANQQLEANLAEVQHARDAALEVAAMKTEFLNVMSHEMLTPLNAIIGFGHLLLVKEIDPKTRERIQVILSSGQQLQSLLEKVLDFSRIVGQRFALQSQALRVSDVVQAVRLEYLAQAEGKGLLLRTSSASLGATSDGDSGAELFAWGDVQQLTRVMGYIVDNAIQLTSKGGVEISYRAIATGDKNIPQGWLSHLKPGQPAIVIMVQDSGQGIAEKDAPKIFDIFRQVDGTLTRSHRGVGLSLVLAQHIMHLHKGDLWFESQPGEGTTFFVLIPAKL